MDGEPSISFDFRLKDTNLMFPEVNKVDDELLQFSAESDKLKIEKINTSDDELLELPNSSRVLDLSKSQESLENTSKEKKDPLTGEENNPVAEIAPLVDETSDGVEIQLRSSNSSDPGNNRRKAENIGTLDKNGYDNSDSVSRRDRKDFYKFTLEEKGEVDISLSGLRRNADLYLHNSWGKAIEKSRKGGRRSEAISETLETGDYYVQVRSRNRRVSTNYDLELNFEPIELGYITLTTPNVGGSWKPGDTINIGWNDNISENVKIDLYKGSDLYGTIDSTTESDGSYDWTIPANLPVGSDYNIKIASTRDGNIYDFGDGNFTVAEPGFITVTTPNGGESWEPGNIINIAWNDNINENVKIDLYKGGIFQGTIDSTTESDGSYDWTIPADLAVGSDYNIKVASTANGNIYDFGDGNFTVAEPDFITVTAPNIGGTWEPGDTINIGWSDNISENVKIDLYKGGIFQSTINSTTESNGSYSWTIPADLTAGTDYNIKIASTTNSSVYDLGDRYFTIKQGIIEEPPANERAEWQGWVSKWDASSGAPSPVNVNENTSFELVGKLNLGSNIREGFDGRHGINNADWGAGSVKAYSELPTDNFLVKAYTEVDLEGGKTYKFEAKGDDGYQIWLKNLDTDEWRWVTPENQWQNTIDRKEEIDTFTHTIPGDKGGRYYVGFFHYENTGDAYFGLNWKEKDEVIIEPPANEREEWQGWVSKWDASSGALSPVNVNENTDLKLVGKLNLGSNVREIFDDGRHGINNADWGAGSVKGYSQLPTDNFLVKAYTEVDLEGGQTYEFEAKGDDGYQIWLKNLDTNEWRWVTPENEWQTTVDQTDTDKFTHTIPGDKGGRYYVGFFHSENGGDAYFGLNWKEVIPIEDNSEITTALDNLNGIVDILSPSNSYPGQCVSFVKRFTQELGITMNPMGGDGGARYGFINFDQPGLSLSAEQADKIVFTGGEQPKVGDIIFFDATDSNRWGHVAVVHSVLDNGRVVVQESNYDGRAGRGTEVQRRELDLSHNNLVMGWLRLKL